MKNRQLFIMFHIIKHFNHIFKGSGQQYLWQNNHPAGHMYICSASMPMAVSCEVEVKLAIN